MTHPSFPMPFLRFCFRRIALMWCLIATMILLIQVADCAIAHDNENARFLFQFIGRLPAFLRAAFGGEAMQSANVESLIAIGYQHPLVLLLYMYFAVSVPSGLLTRQTQQGTMELILSRSCTKTGVFLCVALLSVAGMFALALIMFLGTIAGTRMFDFGHVIQLYPFFRVAINGGLLASAVGAISLLAAASFQRRNTAIGVTVVYLVVNYFVWVVAQWWPRMKFMGPLSLFHYVDGPAIFRNPAWPWSDMGVLFSILVAASVIGGMLWHWRDLPQ